MHTGSSTPVKTDKILKKAFTYWGRTIVYQLLFSLISLSVFLSIGYYAALRYGVLDLYLGLSEKLQQGIEQYQQGVQEMMSQPGFMNFYWIMVATAVFLYPLNLGLFAVYRKLDTQERPKVSDLFLGYAGKNFFIFASFYLFWLLIYIYTVPTIILAVVWVLITLFSAPLMFFLDKKMLETLSLNYKALKRFPMEILLCCMVAVLFKYGGIFTIVGALFTYPFWNAIIYSLYSSLFNEKPEN